MITAIVGVLGMLLAAASFATSAGAAPYSNQTTASVSTTTPAPGSTINVSGSGFLPNETINITLHTKTYELGTTTADAAGDFSTTVTLPDGVTGSHTLISTGETSGRTATVALCIGGSCGTAAGTTTTGGGGGLASTGVAVIGIGALGLVLLIGGGLMLLAGRRRNAAV